MFPRLDACAAVSCAAVKRMPLLLLTVGLGLVSWHCSGGELAEMEENNDVTIVVEADKSRILQQERSLKQRRQAVRSERDRLSSERQRVRTELASLAQKDKKQREKLEREARRLETSEQDLRERLSSFEVEREALAQQKTELLRRIATMTQRSGGRTVAEREAAVALREAAVTQRERALGEREKRVAERERAAVQTLANLTDTLQALRVNPPRSGTSRDVGGAPSRTQAQRLLRQVGTKMDQRGILLDDLPPTARNLYRTAQAGHESGDHGSAHEALTELGRIIDGIAINRDFVQAKFLRLSRRADSRQLDARRQKKVQGLLSEINESFNDGRFDRANRKANQIAALLK